MVKFELDKIFNVLRHPIRRVIIERLADQGWIPLSGLVSTFDISLPGAMKHLEILEESGIISSAKEEHVRYCVLNAKPLAKAADWFESVIIY